MRTTFNWLAPYIPRVPIVSPSGGCNETTLRRADGQRLSGDFGGPTDPRSHRLRLLLLLPDRGRLRVCVQSYAFDPGGSTVNLGFGFDPAVSPDGTRVAFVVLSELF